MLSLKILTFPPIGEVMCMLTCASLGNVKFKAGSVNFWGKVLDK